MYAFILFLYNYRGNNYGVIMWQTTNEYRIMVQRLLWKEKIRRRED